MKNKIPLISIVLIIVLLIGCEKSNERKSNTINPTSTCMGGPSTVIDADGNVYNVITIGNQCWMAENLRVTKYKDGSNIPGNLSNTVWQYTSNGAQADYVDNPSNSLVYGKLYNWYAVTNPAGLCPAGWHVPDENDWNTLVMFLDSTANTQCQICDQSLIAGGSLKEVGTLQDGTGLWAAPNGGATNSSGFSGLPGGGRLEDGTYGGGGSIGADGVWWSSSQSVQGEVWGRWLNAGNASIVLDYKDKNEGLSVRCVRN